MQLELEPPLALIPVPVLFTDQSRQRLQCDSLPLIIVLFLENACRSILGVELQRQLVLLVQPEEFVQHCSGCTLEAVDDVY